MIKTIRSSSARTAAMDQGRVIPIPIPINRYVNNLLELLLTQAI
jgi:hypothetical protein